MICSLLAARSHRQSYIIDSHVDSKKWSGTEGTQYWAAPGGL